MLIELLEPTAVEDRLAGLAEVLVDCVEGGASVGFLAPLPHAQAVAWWREALAGPGVRAWVARGADGSVVGCVLLCLTAQDNARHRADIRKLLVHRQARGLGVAGALMAAVEQDAKDHERTLLLLDTQSGSPAERFYLARGWVPFGAVPAHSATPDGVLADTTYLLKRL